MLYDWIQLELNVEECEQKNTFSLQQISSTLWHTVQWINADQRVSSWVNKSVKPLNCFLHKEKAQAFHFYQSLCSKMWLNWGLSQISMQETDSTGSGSAQSELRIGECIKSPWHRAG